MSMICSFSNDPVYVCFEHTTYVMEFSEQFGPYFSRIECGKEIDIVPEFDENNDYVCTKYAFLWEIFEEWNNRRNK